MTAPQDLEQAGSGPDAGARPRAGAGRRLGWWAALTGIVAAAGGLAVAQIVAAFVAPGAGPAAAVGGAAVDATPAWLREWAIGAFGTGDKTFLFSVMALLALLGAALAGVLELRRAWWGCGLVGLVALAAAVVAAMRPDGYGAWAAPSLIGGVVAVPLLRAMNRRLRSWQRGVVVSGLRPDTANDLDRRRFLTFTAAAGLGAVVVAFGSRAVSATGRAVAQARTALRLPTPAKTAPPVPAGAELGIDGLTPYVTSNDTFYRIDTALLVPQVNPDSWSLRITGMVDHEVELSWQDVLALPLEEHDLTLACVSNTVGGHLIGNARWLGYPLRHLIARAGPTAGADMVLSRSVDGFTAGTPLEVLTDPDRASLLAIGMNGEPLPLEHGFPARLVVPGLYGYVSATKWVTELKVTRFADARGYWTDRGWSARGPIRTESRIDTPGSGRSLKAGTVPVAGVAWDQHTGIAKVEVQVDDGAWQAAELAEVANVDTWRQWVYRWQATKGEHRLRVRATNKDGKTQTSNEAPPVPSGATGWDEVTVHVA